MQQKALFSILSFAIILNILYYTENIKCFFGVWLVHKKIFHEIKAPNPFFFPVSVQKNI